MSYRHIGTPARRPDGADKVTGKTLYIHDLERPGMLWGKIKFSEHAHARIRHIDTSKASRLPGVRAVLTGANTPELRLECPDAHKFEVVERAAARLRARDDVREVIDVDGARAVFDGGWGLVRASNTGPVLVMRCEARDEARLAEIRAIVEGEIEAARG